MSTLLLLLTGPLQSWGERARFRDRDTLPHPTRSGIIGLLSSALGQARDDDLSWADGLTVHVRADNPGVPMSDYHTVGGNYPREKAMVNADGKPRRNLDGSLSTLVTRRFYLADAAFVAAVSADDEALIERLADAARHPRWPLFLGRKSCPPAHPVVLGTTPADGHVALAALPAYTTPPAPARASRPPASAGTSGPDWFEALAHATHQTPTAPAVPPVERTVYLDRVDPADAYTLANDNPTSFHRTGRAYRTRSIGADLVTIPAAGTGLRGYQTIRAAIPTLTGAR